MNDAKMWESFEKMSRQLDDLFKELHQQNGYYELHQRNGYYRITKTYITNSTAEPETGHNYSDGFDDGWNAHEATT